MLVKGVVFVGQARRFLKIKDMKIIKNLGSWPALNTPVCAAFHTNQIQSKFEITGYCSRAAAQEYTVFLIEGGWCKGN